MDSYCPEIQIVNGRYNLCKYKQINGSSFPYHGINVSFDTFKDVKIHGVDVFQFNRGANHERK